MSHCVDQVAGRGKIPDGFGDKGLAQRQATIGRAAVAHPAVGVHVRLRRAGLANSDELPVLVVEFAQLIFQHGEQPGLNAVPEYAQSCQCVHGSASLLTGYV